MNIPMPNAFQKEDLLTIFTSIPPLILVLKPDERFTISEVTDTYLKATFTKREEIVGRGLFEVFPDNPNDPKADGSSKLKASLNTVISSKKQHIMEAQKYDISVGDGSAEFTVKYWNPKNTPVLDSDGRVIYIIHEVEDITQSMLLQEELKRQSELLEESQERISSILNALLKYTVMDFSEKLTVSEKGDELDAIITGINAVVEELAYQMEKLTHLNDQLEYANKELDSFSYSVSHDLRAPLRAINGYAQILAEDYSPQLDENGRFTIDVIMKNAKKMGALIDDLLTFSRVGKQNMTRVSLNMKNIVESILSEYSSRENIKFIIGEIAPAEGDGSMIKQVFTNLISNAVKYSGKKEQPVIEIGSQSKGDKVVYFVKDNGAGFDMQYYEKLFGVFQRLHGAHEFEGTGVGLALVQRIIKKHRGEVWAEGEIDKGATFYFSLPTN